MSPRVKMILLAVTIMLPTYGPAQLTRFQPAPQPAPRAPTPPLQRNSGPPLKRANEQNAWYKRMLWCRSRPDQGRAEGKKCR